MTAPVPVTQFGEELEDILATAYAFPGGLRDLNRVTEPKLGINTIRDAAGEPSPMADVISALRELIESRGLVHQAIVTFYVALPGNAALRACRRSLRDRGGLTPRAVRRCGGGESGAWSARGRVPRRRRGRRRGRPALRACRRSRRVPAGSRDVVRTPPQLGG